MKQFLILFTFFWSFFLFFSSGIVESQDGLQYLAIARQIYYNHTVAMPDAKYPNDNIHMNVNIGKDRKDYAPTGLGFSLAYLPAVALEDVFNRLAGLSPTQNFPLDNDWPIMLFGSMTNAFFGALFVTVFFYYLRSFKFNNKTAFLLSFVLFISSNLFVYSKFGYAHLMFTSFLLLAFFCIRKYKLTTKKYWLLFAGSAYGVVVISYNPTFLFSLPALGLYYVSAVNWKKWQATSSLLKNIASDVIWGIIGVVPWSALYFYFNWVRFDGILSTSYGSGAISAPTLPPAFVLFEGVWGLLFSPGKSIFLFTPILLIPILFWFKLQRKWWPELVAGLILFFVYLYFIGSLVGGVDYYPWHGESCFGPRYMLPIIPFVLLIAALLYRRLSKWQKMLAFWPIVVFGIVVEMVGILVPYQVRFGGLEYQIYLNGERITYNEYANFMPRWSPLYTMSKRLARKILEIPTQYFTYSPVVLVDGASGPMITREKTVWRQLKPMVVTQMNDRKIDQLVFSFVHQVATPSAEYPAEITATADGVPIANVSLLPDTHGTFKINKGDIKQWPQQIILQTNFVGTSSAELNNHWLFLESISADDSPVSLMPYQYPYVSRISEKLQGQQYNYWGGSNRRLWDLWMMRAIIFENTLDLWWLRPLHYWDLPKKFFAGLFLGNVV
ncbi:MAG: hypothetical protein COU68_05270, partial [Candidatus Pacebacteria bacterium CG10_big_fil_rev_8_21_14_0_10_45_6]